MENVVESTGRIESLYQKQMIKNMLERVSYKNKEILSPDELKEIETKFMDSTIDYNQRLSDLTLLHSYNGEQVKAYVSGSSQQTFSEPKITSEEQSLEKPKILVKTPPKPFNFH